MPGSGVWMPNMLVGINNKPMSSTTVPATTGEKARCNRGRNGARASGTTAMVNDMPKTSGRPPIFPAAMIGVMKAKLVPVIESRPLPNPRNEMT